jgi:ABC-type multidrug transport system ATPase subunit
VRDPRLLLLDEPHAGLDAPGRALLDAVVDGAGGEERTVVLASHEVSVARALATREVVLTGGRVTADVPLPGTTGSRGSAHVPSLSVRPATLGGAEAVGGVGAG